MRERIGGRDGRAGDHVVAPRDDRDHDDHDDEATDDDHEATHDHHDDVAADDGPADDSAAAPAGAGAG